MTDQPGRSALVIAVPEVQRHPDLALPVAVNDADTISKALGSVGYTVTTIGTTSPVQCSRSSLMSALADACRTAPRGGILVIYASGHGVHHDGRDYLVPWDADLDYPRVDDMLVDIDVAALADTSPADVIVVFIDACRVRLGPGTKSIFGAHALDAARDTSTSTSLVYVKSCAEGEVAHHTGGRGGYSVFSRALAEVLSSSHPAATLDQVTRATQERVEEIRRTTRTGPQTVTVQCERTDVDPMQVTISRGGGALPADSTWTAAARGSALWGKLSAAARPDHVERVRAETVRIVEAAATAWARSTADGPDPWLDGDHPVRVLRAMEHVAGHLSPAEAGLLVCIPFIRERVYQAAVDAHHPLVGAPDRADVPGIHPLLGQRFEVTRKAHPQLVRRSDRLLPAEGTKRTWRTKRAELAANVVVRRSIETWLLHKHLRRVPVQWHPPPDGTLPPFSRSPGASDDLGEVFQADRLLKLAQCVGCDPERLTRQGGPMPSSTRS